jgi:hypothetical protein
VGEHDRWVKLLESKEEQFKHGWHCVKQSDQNQLREGVTWEQARKNEETFFKDTTPWSTLSEAHRHRLGTPFLTQALGSILFDLIRQR